MNTAIDEEGVGPSRSPQVETQANLICEHHETSAFIGCNIDGSVDYVILRLAHHFYFDKLGKICLVVNSVLAPSAS